jgi:phosphatidylglycerol:prolipoprotein diacylglycerol transferase
MVEAGFQAEEEAVVAVVAGKKKFTVICALALGIYLLFFYIVRFEININPVIFSIGLFQLKWYGLLIATAIYLSYTVSKKRFKLLEARGINHDTVFLLVVFLGVLGARIGFVIQNLSYFSQNILEVFYLWQGGLSIHGAIIGGLIAFCLVTLNKKVTPLEIANAIVPELLLGIAIGRFGNFTNGEIIGQPENGFLKMYVDPANRPEKFLAFSYFHPVFLYESVLLVTAYLLFLYFQKRLKDIAVFYVLVTYNLIRFCVEFFRIDYRPILWIFDLAQIVSFAIITLTIITYIIIARKNGKSRTV